ncbi:hypothetical protein RJT34_11490 [Clitoria ternatea]|uniref:Uncharacterized protein n=1 Tax=Clitoria ternatea TaxID=43366 RepID=A0AAN9JK70_CLITE
MTITSKSRALRRNFWGLCNSASSTHKFMVECRCTTFWHKLIGVVHLILQNNANARGFVSSTYRIVFAPM